ncbi:peptide chain release factor N(5)-glutamine methyltransferase [Niastella caeni]|uniref:peptide chain release factor N(5)-glutamine methyltransferase n=1 Tax=Niastella caeni TaxID=2569763 RepID=A0A4S8HYJ2_9BACT|nr:peptide chain release factor N(5)-glutamine methyltransferase [Niastella caeni]THU39899.1 peptide chain release factor N(5)-glutamine methyltransferase [Niastella caeni]
MTLQEAQQQLQTSLHELYDNREAANIADWVMEHVTGMRKIDRIMHKQSLLSPDRIAQLKQYTQELLTNKPVQYVLHEAWFCGMPFYVDESVLIPRPETEELVEWVVAEVGNRSRTKAGAIGNKDSSYLVPPTSYLSILDIGTGSGCIPIALKKKLPEATIYACDVSEQALAVAAKNAAAQQTPIQFLPVDFLDAAAWSKLPAVGIIVSNPPYIPQHNKNSMLQNVLAYEPHLALFVPNEDPLLFYDAIARFAQQKLLPGGSIFAEIHEDLGEQTKTLFESKGFKAEVKKDFQGKERMVKAEIKNGNDIL